MFGLQDVSVEHRLQQKYKLELQQKEVFIRKLDRKLFEVSFLLEVSTGINRQGGALEIIRWALEMISERFHFSSAAFLQMSSGPTVAHEASSQVQILATSGEVRTDQFWQQLALDPQNRDYVQLSYSTMKDTLGVLVYTKTTELGEEDIELLRNASVQLIARLERDLLYSSSVTDEKTGLYNSRFLRAALEKEMRRSRRGEDPFGFIVIDIDHFKKFNDTYGHQTGDEVLAHVAKVLGKCVRDMDVAARFGGEEFCVIAIKSSTEGLKLMMERIRTSIESAKVETREHGPLSVTVSLGGVMYAQAFSSVEMMFEAADAALYEAKKTGRNRWIMKV